MHQSETFGFAIARPLSEVYEFLLEPANFAKWAFVGEVDMRHLGGRDWSVETSVGPRIIRFAERNAHGVLDHFVLLHEGDVPHPTGMWVVANGAGTQMTYTNFRRDGVTDEQWESLKTWIQTDLLALQSLLESEGKVEPMFPSKVVSLGIGRPVRVVFDFLARPENFGKWAFAGETRMEPLGDGEWAVETSVGPRVVRFGGRNTFGILTYYSRLTAGDVPHAIPMRVMPNGEGTELIYVFYQRPGVTDEQWASVIEWVTTDLLALKSMLEASI